MASLPVSVVVPHQTSRLSFFVQAAFPQIVRNQASQIIVLPGSESPAAKRNAGARMATSDFLFFCDDDVVLRGGCLSMMVTALQNNPAAAFAYSDFDHVVYPGVPFVQASGRVTAGPWDAAKLRKENYVSTMSLVRRSAFLGFDESLTTLWAWDLWLGMVAKGAHGIYIPEVLFESHHVDLGITMTAKLDEPLKKVREKHGLA